MLRKVLSVSINTLRVGKKKMEPVVFGGRTRANGHKLKYMKCHLNIQTHFFTVRVVKHSSRLYKRGCGVSILGNTQNSA